MENLLKATLDTLEKNNLTPKDVLWVGNTEVKTTWEQFASVADVEYDDSYGAAHVPTDLVVVGKDWWLERAEYDGSEWWEFKKLPTMPDKDFNLTKVTGGMWSTLKKLGNY